MDVGMDLFKAFLSPTVQGIGVPLGNLQLHVLNPQNYNAIFLPQLKLTEHSSFALSRFSLSLSNFTISNRGLFKLIK